MDSPGAKARTRVSPSRAPASAAQPGEMLRIDPAAAPPDLPPQPPVDYAIRLFDLVAAAGLLLALLPAMIVVALLVKLTSRGPALFVQERVGLGGRRFRMIKFRTMRADAESLSGPVWARRDDARCTPLGKLLRRYSIDELPQFWNVARGDMSLVGPRPERPFFVRKFAQELPGYMDRHAAPPGITGWAQINGCRGDTSVARRLQLDLEYVRRRSLRFNLWILLLTPWKVLVDRNAY